MVTIKRTISEHDVVELRDRIGEWPAGTGGTVVSERGAWKLVEVSDELGAMLDLISVREPGLRLISKHGTSR